MGGEQRPLVSRGRPSHFDAITLTILNIFIFSQLLELDQGKAPMPHSDAPRMAQGCSGVCKGLRCWGPS